MTIKVSQLRTIWESLKQLSNQSEYTTIGLHDVQRSLEAAGLLIVNDWAGATGEYPDGQLNEDDEGELQLSIGEKAGTLIIDFGKPVSWVGMRPVEAQRFAEVIMQRAHRMLTQEMEGS